MVEHYERPRYTNGPGTLTPDMLKTMAASIPLTDKAESLLRETGTMASVGLEATRKVFSRPWPLAEFLDQLWFLAKVTTVPVILISIPFGMVISLQVGSLIRQAVAAWHLWGLESNTHFGSLTLMMPIALAAARPGDLHDEVRRILAETTVSDAVEFYRAFCLAKARVADVESFSLNDDGWEGEIAGSKKTLLELMRLSCGHDLIAREWSTGFERTFILADRIVEQTQEWGINDATVRVFLQALWEEPDSLICAKFGIEEARRVSKIAGEALLDETLNRAREIDAELLEKDINPGSTADLIAAALFISLLRGLRF